MHLPPRPVVHDPTAEPVQSTVQPPVPSPSLPTPPAAPSSLPHTPVTHPPIPSTHTLRTSLRGRPPAAAPTSCEYVAPRSGLRTMPRVPAVGDNLLRFACRACTTRIGHHPGPDGSATLCGPCYYALRKAKLPLYAANGAAVTAVPNPGATRLRITGFPSLGRCKLDVRRPYVQPCEDSCSSSEQSEPPGMPRRRSSAGERNQSLRGRRVLTSSHDGGERLDVAPASMPLLQHSSNVRTGCVLKTTLPPSTCLFCEIRHPRVTGPDGKCTLCTTCYQLYVTLQLPLYERVDGSGLTVVPNLNAKRFVVTGFPRASPNSGNRDLGRPYVRPASTGILLGAQGRPSQQSQKPQLAKGLRRAIPASPHEDETCGVYDRPETTSSPPRKGSAVPRRAAVAALRKLASRHQNKFTTKISSKLPTVRRSQRLKNWRPMAEKLQPPLHLGISNCLRCKRDGASSTGPDGYQTLCKPCSELYRIRALQVYEHQSGQVSVLPAPGAVQVMVIGFYTGHGMRNDLLRPIVRVASNHTGKRARNSNTHQQLKKRRLASTDDRQNSYSCSSTGSSGTTFLREQLREALAVDTSPVLIAKAARTETGRMRRAILKAPSANSLDRENRASRNRQASCAARCPRGEEPQEICELGSNVTAVTLGRKGFKTNVGRQHHATEDDDVLLPHTGEESACPAEISDTGDDENSWGLPSRCAKERYDRSIAGNISAAPAERENPLVLFKFRQGKSIDRPRLKTTPMPDRNLAYPVANGSINDSEKGAHENYRGDKDGWMGQLRTASCSYIPRRGRNASRRCHQEGYLSGYDADSEACVSYPSKHLQQMTRDLFIPRRSQSAARLTAPLPYRIGLQCRRYGKRRVSRFKPQQYRQANIPRQTSVMPVSVLKSKRPATNLPTQLTRETSRLECVAGKDLRRNAFNLREFQRPARVAGQDDVRNRVQCEDRNGSSAQVANRSEQTSIAVSSDLTPPAERHPMRSNLTRFQKRLVTLEKARSTVDEDDDREFVQGLPTTPVMRDRRRVQIFGAERNGARDGNTQLKENGATPHGIGRDGWLVPPFEEAQLRKRSTEVLCRKAAVDPCASYAFGQRPCLGDIEHRSRTLERAEDMHGSAKRAFPIAAARGCQDYDRPEVHRRPQASASGKNYFRRLTASAPLVRPCSPPTPAVVGMWRQPCFAAAGDAFGDGLVRSQVPALLSSVGARFPSSGAPFSSASTPFSSAGTPFSSTGGRLASAGTPFSSVGLARTRAHSTAGTGFLNRSGAVRSCEGGRARQAGGSELCRRRWVHSGTGPRAGAEAERAAASGMVAAASVPSGAGYVVAQVSWNGRDGRKSSVLAVERRVRAERFCAMVGRLVGMRRFRIWFVGEGKQLVRVQGDAEVRAMLRFARQEGGNVRVRVVEER